MDADEGIETAETQQPARQSRSRLPEPCGGQVGGGARTQSGKLLTADEHREKNKKSQGGKIFLIGLFFVSFVSRGKT